jgi:hypothetical protein
MVNYYSNSEPVKKFYDIKIAEVLRQDLGIKSFSEVESKLKDIYFMIEEMITNSELNEDVPEGVKQQVIQIISQFNAIANSLKIYNIDSDASGGFRQRASLIQNINTWYSSIFLGRDSNNNIVNFLQVYNTIKIYNLLSLQKDKTEIDSLKSQLETTTKQANDVIKLLQSKASEETVQDYALIFQSQAQRHSFWHLTIKPFKIILGNAQVWLLISILSLCLFGLFAYNLNSIFPINLDKAPSVVTLELVTRLLIISVAIYVISFCFKQYNVQNHLATLNKHRQNTLNSFKLFMSSLDPNDASTRNALLIEVAKAIYEAGNSGYITSKDGGEGSPSIVEMTRFIGQK